MIWFELIKCFETTTILFVNILGIYCFQILIDSGSIYIIIENIKINTF